ncbi:MAG: integrase [Methanobrevibacter sp.]|uniref:integrase n=1 Tax=Methanobrevibacter sp. TaxID=66852 RepID=UPI002E79ACBD|nr:integrase [Methanobrevibacter sp.]MEE0935317.1 integrase [Methanobrevibacter sp.]
MNSNELFQKFCKDRNIKSSTQKGYESALKCYENFQKDNIKNLFAEARMEENKKIPLKDRRIKKRLIDFRSFLLNSSLTPKTSKTYFSKVKTFYLHFEFELPHLQKAKYDKIYETNYLDLPTREHIHEALLISPIDVKAVILFMSSSGTAMAETLSLTINHFIIATQEYHNGGSMENIFETLEKKVNVVPTFYLKRIKTDKYYYTFCSPEASLHIVKYLKTRHDLKLEDKLFDFSTSQLFSNFQEINDKMKWGFKGKYRFFRSHTLRKFHASNIGLSAEYVDALQGRSKNEIHEAYIKTNPSKLKEIYMSVMKNIMICDKNKEMVKKQEFNIIINVFLSGKEFNIV